MTNREKLIELMNDRTWRLNHLYWIENKEGQLVRFSMNWAQQEFHENIWYRNDILKARQLGISTYTALLMLDSCMYTSNFRAGITDKTLPDAQQKLGKITLAYDMLDYVPEDATEEDIGFAELGRIIKNEVKIVARAKTGIELSNGSSVRVGTSLRGGTLQLLHVSELGHVAVHNPTRAQEIVTGSINAVSKDGVVIRESTHEGGRAGINYQLTKKSMDNVGRELSNLDNKFFFFPWWKSPEYRIDDRKAIVNDAFAKYFDGLSRAGIDLDDGQKTWYISMSAQMGNHMRQEYPSTPDEAFDSQSDECIYAAEMNFLREKGRMNCRFEYDSMCPFNVSFDIGMGDHMAFWGIQEFKTEHRVLDHYQANNKGLGHYVEVLRDWERRYGHINVIYLPHDCVKRDWDALSFEQKLRNAGFNVIKVPRTPDIWRAIDSTREFLKDCVFHERCNEPIIVDEKEYISGVNALSNYRTAPPGANGALRDMPLHDVCSDSADAFRTYAQAFAGNLVTTYNSTLSKSQKSRAITGLGIARSGGFRRSNDDW